MNTRKRFPIRIVSLLACSLYAVACDPAPKQNPEVAPAPKVQAQDEQADQAEVIPEGYEEIPQVSIRARSRGVQTLLIKSRENPMEIEVYEDHELVDSNTQFVRSGKRVGFEESGHEYPLIGHVVGEEDSAVQFVRTERGLEGLVLAQGKVFELRGDSESKGRSFFGEVKDTAGYAHEHGVHAEPGSCGVEDGIDRDEGNADVIAGVQKRDFEPGSEGCRLAEIVLLADWTYVKKLGGVWQAELEMMRRMGEVNMIYRKQLGVKFRVRGLHVFPDRDATENNPAFNTSHRDPTPLKELKKWKGENEPDVALVHLFVARTTMGVVGRANLGGTCGKSRGAGVSNYMGNGLTTPTTIAHEIGHNFGAKHDNEKKNPTIMSSSIGGLRMVLSDLSVGEINRSLPKFNCLKPIKCTTVRSQQPALDIDLSDSSTDSVASGSPPVSKLLPGNSTGASSGSTDSGLAPDRSSSQEDQSNPQQEGDEGSALLQRCSFQSNPSGPWDPLLSLGLLGFALRTRKRRSNYVLSLRDPESHDNPQSPARLRLCGENRRGG